MFEAQKVFLIATALTSVHLPRAVAQVRSPSANTPRIIQPSVSWANQQWTGDNRPYHAIRVQTDQLAARGGLTLAVLKQYEQGWSRQPRNPLFLFRWVYADNLARRRYPNLPPHMSPGEGAYDQPGLVDPQAYDYERSRFLLSWESGNQQALIPLAKRLAVRDPNDFAVQYQLAGLYSGTDTPTQKAASILRVKRLIARYPQKRLGLYSILGGIYCQHWLAKQDASDAQQATRYYTKYLQLAPANDPWRKQAKYWIDYIHNPPF